MLANEDVIYLGYIAKPHGYEGKLKVNALSGSLPTIKTEWVFIKIDEKPVPFFIESIQTSSSEWIIQLSFISSSEDASKYKNLHLGVLKTDLPEEEISKSYSWKDVQVFNQDYVYIGVIDQIIEQSFQPLISVLDKDKNEILIPFVEDWIIAFDDDKKELTLDLPEGLLDL